VSVRLYDSLQQAVVDFDPINPGHVSMYVCGPTVQSQPHIGHLRSALVYDLWSRWLEYRGLDVTMVRNVTDIDDKILEKSAESGEPWWQLASWVEKEFHQASDALGIRRPALEPRATGDIPAMVSLIERLIERRHAYVADDGSGDVYFDVASWPHYGELTRQKTEDMVSSPESGGAKRAPYDFALWKGHKNTEPDTAQWPAPWGAGRPGWHLECSAMSARYLGAQFDIHGGGLDLRFPHHENELAQSRAAGDPFARHWLHSALVMVNGQKMSKSLGNSIYASDWLGQSRPVVIRYALATAHYRSDIDIHEGFLDEAAAAFGRIEGFLGRTAALASSAVSVPEEFARAMDDDLSIPQALATLHDTVRAGNQAVDSGNSGLATELRASVVSMLEVLGLNPESPQWVSTTPQEGNEALTAVVEAVIAARNEARAAKNFDLADSLRDVLSDAGVDVVDTDHGAEWSIRG
jgi:cysteinyl-tRNA synthetase